MRSTRQNHAAIRAITEAISFDALETRAMMSAAPSLTMSVRGSDAGAVITLRGTPGNDNISVTYNNRYFFTNGATTLSYRGKVVQIRILAGSGNDAVTIQKTLKVNTNINGGAGDDTLRGGAGSDTLYGGAGRDLCYGYGGDDTIVSIGDSTSDYDSGGVGYDEFWLDSNSTEQVADATYDETAGGAVHRVTSFSSTGVGGSTVSKDLNAQQLADPTYDAAASGYTNFSNHPLFASTGPSVNDIVQGQVGDCYFLSTLSAIAKLNPNVIKNSVVDLGDGTYAVQFTQGVTKTFIRVDGDLPTTDWGSLAYAKCGGEGSIWVAIMEKAFAFFRTNAGTYASLTSGYMSEAFGDLGCNSSSISTTSNATSLMQSIEALLDAGKAVTFATKHTSTSLVSDHAYMVDGVVTDSHGTVTGLRVRNPWGCDDLADNGANDGYETITPAQAFQCFSFVTSSAVA